MSFNSPCAACKLQRRKCTPGCVFAPYFPPEQPGKFVCVHRVFGASNVAKMLSELSPAQREDAANSLAFEAEARLRDPVYGCVGYISILQRRLQQVQHDLQLARKELSAYVNPPPAAALAPPQTFIHHQLNFPATAAAATGPFCGVLPAGMGVSPTAAAQQILTREQPHQLMTAMAVAAREQDMMRSYEQHQYHRYELARLSAGFPDEGGGGRTQSYNQLSADGGTMMAAAAALAFEAPLASVQPPQRYTAAGALQQQQQHRTRIDEGRSGIGGPTSP